MTVLTIGAVNKDIIINSVYTSCPTSCQTTSNLGS